MSKQSKITYVIIVLLLLLNWFVIPTIKVEENTSYILDHILYMPVFFLLINNFNIFKNSTWQKQLFYCFVFIAFTELLLNYKNVTSSLLTIAGYLGGAIITFLLFTIFSSLGNREKYLAK